MTQPLPEPPSPFHEGASYDNVLAETINGRIT
jgi:hypothetical protein